MIRPEKTLYADAADVADKTKTAKGFPLLSVLSAKHLHLQLLQVQVQVSAYKIFPIQSSEVAHA